jgi:hypothetical protein
MQAIETPKNMTEVVPDASNESFIVISEQDDNMVFTAYDFDGEARALFSLPRIPHVDYFKLKLLPGDNYQLTVKSNVVQLLKTILIDSSGRTVRETSNLYKGQQIQTFYIGTSVYIVTESTDRVLWLL